MGTLHLPDDLKSFLRRGEQLKYDARRCECGQVKLSPLDRLKLGEVWIRSDNSPLAESDPHADEDGYYAVPVVNLVAEAGDYDPNGIFLWLPDIQLYGAWDSDHWDLIVFPGVTWNEISTDPLPYINAQWDPDGIKREFFKPWPRYEFRLGRPF